MGNYSISSPMTFKDRVIYALLYGFAYALSLLPFRVLFLLSDFIFVILYHWVKYRRPVVRKNLRDSFPEKSDEERAEIERKFYHFFCDYIFETIKMMSMSKAKMQRHMQFKGMEHVCKACDEGHSVALYLAHYCNWEWVTSITLGIPPYAFGGQVYHILESKAFDAFMLKLRSRWGSENIERHILLRKVVSEYRKGKKMVIGFISDQGPEMHTIHHWTQFLNHDTAVITGTETVAKKFDFSCVYLDIIRERRGYYTVNVIPLTKISADYKDFEITDMYFKALEQSIRRQPENWLWTHNRWKRTRKQYEEYIAAHPHNKEEKL